MELEQFIEQDIIAFLDEKLHTQEVPIKNEPPKTIAPEEAGLYEPTRDYEGELEAAIRDINRAKAQQLLTDLKKEHDGYPPDAPERLERQHLLERLYRRFQQAFGHEAEQQTAASMPSTGLTTPQQSTTSPQTPPQTIPPQTPTPSTSSQPPETSENRTPHIIPSATIESTAPTSPPRPPQPEPLTTKAVSKETPTTVRPTSRRDESPAHEKRKTLDSSFYADAEHIRTLIAERLLTKAIHQYQELKGRMRLEEMAPAEREAVLHQMKSLYEELKTSIKGLEESTTRKEEQEKERASCEEDIERAESAVASGDLITAMQSFNKAKRECTTPEAKARLRALYQRIKAAENRSGKLLDEAEKKLVGTP